jgi:hypothetical protein
LTDELKTCKILVLEDNMNNKQIKDRATNIVLDALDDCTEFYRESPWVDGLNEEDRAKVFGELQKKIKSIYNKLGYEKINVDKQNEIL